MIQRKDLKLLKDIEAFGCIFSTPLTNGGGSCKTYEDINKLIQTDLGGIEIGSIVEDIRSGNSGDVWYPTTSYSINSLGIPCLGIEYYRKHLPEMVKIIKTAGKVSIVNVAGFSAEEFSELAILAYESGANIVNLNAGCPNIYSEKDGGKVERKEILSYNPNGIREMLNEVRLALIQRFGLDGGKQLFHDKTIVKISPLPPIIFNPVMEVINWAKPAGVVFTNTFPDGFAIREDGSSAINVAVGGFGGVGGPGMKPIALGHIEKAGKILSSDIERVGVGGIENGMDMIEYQQVGVRIMQVTTAYMRKEDPTVLNNILAEYYEFFGESR